MGCIADTPTIHLDVASGVLTGTAKISGDAGNQLSIHSDGLFVAAISGFPIGAMLPYGGIAAPDANWLLCDGSAVSRSTYAALFAVIASGYGSGDGATTFNLPDYRGRTFVGLGPASEVNAIGNNDGVAAGNRRATKHRHSPHVHPRFQSPGNGIWGVGGFGVAVTAGDSTGVDGGSGNANDPLDGPAYQVSNVIIRCS